MSGGTQLPVRATPWNPVPSSGIYDHLHIHGIHTQQHATFEDEEEKEEEELLAPNSNECSAYEMHKLCFHRRSVSQGDGFSLPCCSLVAIQMLLSSPKLSSIQFRNVTTEGGKYLISWLSFLGHSITELSPLFLVHLANFKEAH